MLKQKYFSSTPFLSSIFLSNSELWGITKKISKQIYSSSRRLVPIFAVRIKWQKVLINTEVFSISKL